MHVPELRERGVGCRGDRREVGDVDLHREAARAGVGDLRGHRLRRGLVDVGDDHVHARARELGGDGASDTAPTSGDHRGTTVERVHVASPVCTASQEFAVRGGRE